MKPSLTKASQGGGCHLESKLPAASLTSNPTGRPYILGPPWTPKVKGFVYQPMVHWLFGWFGLLGFPYEKDLLLRGIPSMPNPPTQTTNLTRRNLVGK